MTTSTSTLLARAEIAEAMYRYCRALDRMDRALMATVFAPAATVDYPTLRGTWSEFVEYVWNRHLDFDRHSHQVANMLLRVDDAGASAVSESYVRAVLWRRGTPPAGAGGRPAVEDRDGTGVEGSETETCARYVDKWSRRHGRWCIEHRRCVVDASLDCAGNGWVGGRRDAEDPSYGALCTHPRSPRKD